MGVTARAKMGRAVVSWAVIAGLTSCGPASAPGTKPAPGVEKPVTAAEIRAQFEAVLQPIFGLVAGATADTRVSPELAAQVRSQLDERKSKYASAAAYKEGTHAVVTKLEDSLRDVRDKQNGVLALYLCELIRYFEPNNSRVVRFEQWGQTVKNRPVVTIRGWYEPKDTTVRIVYTFVEVYTPEDGQTHHAQVREGDEIFGLKYVRMIGNKRGILFEYMKTKDRFEVYSPSWLRRQ